MYATLLAFALVIGLGLVTRRWPPGPLDAADMRQTINHLVLNYFLPALCLHVLATAPLGQEALLVPLTAWLTMVASLALAWLVFAAISRPLGLPPPQTGVLILAATFGNITYLGLPVLTGLFGPTAARYALFFDMFAHTPFLWLAGAALAAHFGGQGDFDWRHAGRTVLGLPPLWGCAVGLACNLLGVPLPTFVDKALSMLAGSVVPLMIFSVGLALQWPRRTHLAAMVPLALLKLAVAPGLAYLAASTLGLHGEALIASTLEGAMPTMVVTLLIAHRFGLDEGLAATAIAVTTALAFVTLPVTVWWLTGSV